MKGQLVIRQLDTKRSIMRNSYTCVFRFKFIEHFLSINELRHEITQFSKNKAQLADLPPIYSWAMLSTSENVLNKR